MFKKNTSMLSKKNDHAYLSQKFTMNFKYCLCLEAKIMRAKYSHWNVTEVKNVITSQRKNKRNNPDRL